MSFKEYNVQVYDNGDVVWHLNDEIHREDGPAIECASGHKEYWINGKLHRENGPAIELANGNKEYWINGKVHRESGPAIEWADGRKEFWINGEKISEADFLRRTTTPSCNGKIVEIDGKKYKLVEV